VPRQSVITSGGGARMRVSKPELRLIAATRLQVGRMQALCIPLIGSATAHQHGCCRATEISG